MIRARSINSILAPFIVGSFALILFSICIVVRFRLFLSTARANICASLTPRLLIPKAASIFAPVNIPVNEQTTANPSSALIICSICLTTWRVSSSSVPTGISILIITKLVSIAGMNSVPTWGTSAKDAPKTANEASVTFQRCRSAQ